jgi:hypothetical protein
MPTKAELERELDDVREKLEEARALIEDALGYEDEDDSDDDSTD